MPSTLGYQVRSAGSEFSVAGNQTITLNFRGASTVVLKGPIHGGDTTTILVTGNDGSTSSCETFNLLDGDNRKFTGKIKVHTAASRATDVVAALELPARRIVIDQAKYKIALGASEPFALDGEQAVTVYAETASPFSLGWRRRLYGLLTFLSFDFVTVQGIRRGSTQGRASS